MLIEIQTAAAQTVIFSSTNTPVTIANSGDVTVNAGVTINTSSGGSSAGTAITINGVAVGTLTNNGTLNTGATGGRAIYFNGTLATNIINNGTMTSKGGIDLGSAAAILNNFGASMSGTDRAVTV